MLKLNATGVNEKKTKESSKEVIESNYLLIELFINIEFYNVS